jgi:hypothetical protein
MIVRIINFRRTEDSEYEKGLYIEDSEIIIDACGKSLGIVYDIRFDITCLDFTTIFEKDRNKLIEKQYKKEKFL